MKILVTLILFVVLNVEVYAQLTEVNNQPIELGMVSWFRNYDEALDQANRQKKPLFILFQEVPGCATCQKYGNNVLSNPLIIDAIENEFVPLAIFNNVKGHDREILNKFNEPTWNNPVIRIINTKGKDLVNRHSGDYSSKGLVNYMLTALAIGNYGQPEYLKLLDEELDAVYKNAQSEAVYSMYCFWSGEAHLGALDGVVQTTPGFMNGREVVKVIYDNTKIEQEEITSHAQKANCKLETKKSKFRADKDPQYYLKKSNYKFLALSPLQKTKINTAIKEGVNPNTYLSPTQLSMLNSISKSDSKYQSLYEQNIDDAWWEMKRLLN